MTKMKSTGAILTEPVWFGEVATYRHENAGKVSFETVSTANKEVSPSSDSERITRLGKVRVETKVTEWKGTDDNGKVYQKDVETTQINDASEPTSTSSGKSKPYTQQTNVDDPVPSDGLSPLKVLKNFVDNIAADNRMQWITIVGAAVIATAAFVIAIL